MKEIREVYAKKAQKFISINESIFHWNRKGSTYFKFKNFSKGLTSKQLISFTNKAKRNITFPPDKVIVEKIIKFAQKHPKDRFILVQENSPTVPFPRRNVDAKEDIKDFEAKTKKTKAYKEEMEKYDGKIQKKYAVKTVKQNNIILTKRETNIPIPDTEINWNKIILIIIFLLLILRAILT
jgi:hypothetical protein